MNNEELPDYKLTFLREMEMLREAEAQERDSNMNQTGFTQAQNNTYII
jgi:hypothetical protein